MNFRIVATIIHWPSWAEANRALRKKLGKRLQEICEQRRKFYEEQKTEEVM
jgi:hypothetical protein